MADEKVKTFPMEVRDGQVCCSKCGGTVQCSGTGNFSFVPVGLDEGLWHDWAFAGTCEFEPTEYSCADCGAILTDPGDLTDEESEDDE